MSLPLTRRIAKTVLLTAAGAASVVGTAGAASAAELPSNADVGGLSTLDNELGGQVAGAASQGADALAPMSSNSPLSGPTTPDAGVSAKTNNDKVVPETARFATGTVTDTGAGMEQAPKLERHTPDVRTQGLPTDSAPKTLPAKVPSQVPAQTPVQKPVEQAAKPLGLPTQGLPTSNLLPRGLNVAGLAR